jgi:hypothetical protein
MIRIERRWGALLVAALSVATHRTALADAPEPPPSRLAGNPTAPSRVEIALIGELEQDPALFERIRSLFPREMAVVLRPSRHLDSGAVLQPERADTLYVWLRVSSGTRARVYLVARDDTVGSARYLFRDVVLDSGLDEVASETLAQVAHSSAEAFWLREQQTPRQQVVEALASDSVATRPPPRIAAPPPPVTPSSSPADFDSGVTRSPRAGTAPFNLGFGASFVSHSSGAEGWLAQPEAFVTGQYQGRWSLRLAAQYLVPVEFDLLPARIRLTGASGELRAAWASSPRRTARVRLEAGLGILIGRWSPRIAARDPPAHAKSARDFVRPAALGGGAIELPVGPGWLAARADVRAAFRKTRYEIEGLTATASSSFLNPGGGVEFGILLDR